MPSTTRSLIDLCTRFAIGDGKFDVLMRRALWRSDRTSVGDGLHVGSGVGFKHLETFEIGHGVFLGAQATSKVGSMVDVLLVIMFG